MDWRFAVDLAEHHEPTSLYLRLRVQCATGSDGCCLCGGRPAHDQGARFTAEGESRDLVADIHGLDDDILGEWA